MSEFDDRHGPLKRGRSTLHRVKPSHGNFVFFFPVSRKLLRDVQYPKGDDEFTHTKYTAVTCEPEEFPRQYQLRASRYARNIKVALVVTMYNEENDLFIKSMKAVQKNIAYLCSKDIWGPDGWKNFLVVIVSDGRTKINPETQNTLAVMGCFVPGLPRTSVNDKPTQVHLFEFTTQIMVDRNLEIKSRADNVVPMQVVFILKEKNAKKINSHKWFFNAICESINPEVTMLLDVGTKPSDTSFYHLYDAFARNKKVGGACGEIIAEIGNYGSKLWNPLVASQNFEYKMSNILDKPLESVFGYIAVLPGAFSAYRYSALKGRPLAQYFLGEEPGADIFTSNLYLAEDRILCFELVTKRNEAWVLKYVKSARAETDVPDRLPELISQRRRWLNGSFFAALHSLINFRQIYSSPHSTSQKVIFSIEFLYNAFNLMFSWFSFGNFYLAFHFLFDTNSGTTTRTDGPFGNQGQLVFEILRGIYVFSMIAMVITSLGNRPQGSKKLYYGISIMFSILMILMLFMGGWAISLQIERFQGQSIIDLAVNQPTFRDLVISVAATYGLYLAASLLHLDPWHIFTSMIQYLLVLPTYINMFMVYSFCNLHDVSWGTKGSTAENEEKKPAVQRVENGKVVEFEIEISTEEEDIDLAWADYAKRLANYKHLVETGNDKRDEKTKKEDGTKEFRTRVVLFWIITNLILIVFFTSDFILSKMFANRLPGDINPYLTFLFWSVAFLSLVRFIGCSLFMIQWWGEKISGSRYRSAAIPQESV